MQPGYIGETMATEQEDSALEPPPYANIWTKAGPLWASSHNGEETISLKAEKIGEHIVFAQIKGENACRHALKILRC